MQLVLLLFLSRAFVILTYVPGIGNSVSGASILFGNIIGYAVVLLFFVPLIVMAKKYPERSLVMNLSYAFCRLGPFISVIYYLFIVLLASNTLAHFQFFMVNAVFTEANVWVIILPMMAVAVYAAHIGIEGISRSGFLVTIGFTIAFLFILFSSIPNVEMVNVKLPVDGRMREIALSAYMVVSNTVEVLLFYLLLPYCNRKIKSGVFGLVISLTVLTELVTFFIVSVLGDFAASQTFPFYALASLSELSIFQRLDALHMGIWVFVAFIKLSLLIFLGTEILKFITPNNKSGEPYHRISLLITAVLILGFAVPACYYIEWLRILYRILYSGIPVILLGVIVPIIVLWRLRILKKKQSLKRKDG